MLVRPAHVDDDRVVTAGILRQNARIAPKQASASCHAPPEPFSHGLQRFCASASPPHLAAFLDGGGRPPDAMPNLRSCLRTGEHSSRPGVRRTHRRIGLRSRRSENKGLKSDRASTVPPY